MNKKVSFGTRPSAAQPETSKADDWVNRRDAETMKRLTIDVPASLHARIKSQCAIRGVKMADEVRELLEKHFQ
ncbi:MAG: hypothetical protein ABTQ25_09545 [Nitrosomonas ureae]